MVNSVTRIKMSHFAIVTQSVEWEWTVLLTLRLTVFHVDMRSRHLFLSLFNNLTFILTIPPSMRRDSFYNCLISLMLSKKELLGEYLAVAFCLGFERNSHYLCGRGTWVQLLNLLRRHSRWLLWTRGWLSIPRGTWGSVMSQDWLKPL